MGKYHVMAQHNKHKRIKLHLVGHDAHQTSHVLKEINAFITKKDAKYYTNNIQPFWVMTVTPLFETLKDVHTKKFE